MGPRQKQSAPPVFHRAGHKKLYSAKFRYESHENTELVACFSPQIDHILAQFGARSFLKFSILATDYLILMTKYPNFQASLQFLKTAETATYVTHSMQVAMWETEGASNIHHVHNGKMLSPVCVFHPQRIMAQQPLTIEFYPLKEHSKTVTCFLEISSSICPYSPIRSVLGSAHPPVCIKSHF